MHESACAEAVEEDPEEESSNMNLAEGHPEYEHQNESYEGGYQEGVEAAEGVAEVAYTKATDRGSSARS